MYYFPFQDTFTPLHVAAEYGHVPIVEMLSKSAISLSAPTKVSKMYTEKQKVIIHFTTGWIHSSAHC